MSLVYFTEEVIQNFNGSGMDPLFEALESYQESDPESEDTLAQVFTELLLTFDAEQLEVNDVKKFLGQAIKSDDHARIFFQVMNSFPVSQNIKDLLHLLFRDNKIKPETLALHLSSDFLKAVELVPKEYLHKSLAHSIRDQYYTQKKYNLLHEETEGFSKFISEIFFIFREDETEFQVDYALQITEKLIGHYSLDPNRCLEILFEVFSNAIVSKHRFVLEFFRKSRWWPAVESDNSSLTTLSIGGNEAAAKIIGMKLVSSHMQKDLPETYKMLVVLLIKEGFISFGSIYKYLGPDDEKMEKIKEEYQKKLDREVLVAGANALALAAPLADDEEGEDGKSTSKKKTGTQKEEPGDKLQNLISDCVKLKFLRIFLMFGVYWPSIFILTKYPYLAQIDDDIPVMINRLFAATVDPLYKKFRIFTDEEVQELQESKGVAFSRSHNTVNIEKTPTMYLFTFKAPIKDFANKKFKFFYEEWTHKLPEIDNIDSLTQVSKEILQFNGPYLAKSVIIFIKLCEIVSILLENGEDKTKIFAYFRNFIFPAIPLIEENSVAVDKAYEILKHFPIEDRFSLYGELYNVLAKNNLVIKIAYSKAEKSTKDVLKRLSKENVRPMMRRLAKISFSNPLPCLLTILQQIESYDNLNTLVVETARYFNDYGWDNLTAAILIRLASNRSSTYNGMSERQWAQSLASFIGKICQRYPRAIDIKTILLYILKSFHGGDTLGLLVLKEMFISMGGIQTIANLTLNQIDMINCGSSLQKIVYNTIDDLRFERQITGKYLIRCLKELDAVNELLVLLCRISNELTYTGDEEYLKVLISKSDDLNGVIRLFVTLINLYDDDLNLMSIKELNDLGVPFPWAFEVWRTRGEIKMDQLPADLQNSLFEIFWKLSLHDINYSDDLYNQELSKLESNIKSLKDSIAINVKNKEVTRATIEKQRKELEDNGDYLKLLPEERAAHKEASEKVDSMLESESNEWFSNLKIEDLVQQCIFPRVISSPFDAVFSARFIFKLHYLKTKDYSLLKVLDLFFTSKSLFGILFTSTPTEAENIGLFFADVLRTLQGWTKEENFQKIELKDHEGDVVTFDDYRKILFEYHASILDEIQVGLQATEYISRNNTIIFLKNLLGVYPSVEDHCLKVVKLIEHLCLTETRNDLKLSSNALVVHIKSRSKEWIPIWDFISMSDEEKEAILEKRERIKKRKQRRLEKEKKEKQAREEKERLEREEQEKLAREEEEKKKIAANSLNYDSNSSTARPQSRGSSIRGSYDKYAVKPKDLPTSPKNIGKETMLQRLHQLKSNYKGSQKNKDDNESTTEKVESETKEDDTTKAEVDEKENKEDPPATETASEPEPAVEPTTSKEAIEPTIAPPSPPPPPPPLPPSRSKNFNESKSEVRRAPLPPQDQIKKPISSDTKRTPLPPQRDIQGRGSSGRQPLPSQHEITNRGSMRQPLPPQNHSSSGFDHRSPRGNYHQSAPAQPQSRRNDNFGRSGNNNSSSGRPDSRQLKGRTPTYDNRGRNSGGNRDNRDNRNNSRNDNKRKGDGFGGRNYDKRTKF
ncbi:THO2 THO complex subunit 2 [Candida maltosa Xu316]